MKDDSGNKTQPIQFTNRRPKRQSWILTIYPQATVCEWRGYLEATDGTRLYFASLAQLGELISAYGVSTC